MSAPAGGRPPLARYIVDVVVTVELGAVDHDQAVERALVIEAALRDRTRPIVRRLRTGSPEVTGVAAQGLDDLARA